ncbi:PIG-L family deacetylase [Mycetocola tolaasinivorans]|uniref:PIG-L family deacetylase n=1 Tax=Mycetocola tolaasinivorans TaxID=76635 RepID=UPI0016024207|nr:PIG-L family deacetylase [Mycetocola tolaasinivorans]
MPVASGLPAEFSAGVVLVHAHPDDETLTTSALISALAEADITVTVVTATRGERGEIVPGSVPNGADLTAVRAAELRAALDALGVSRHAYLGAGRRHYRDSGMVWGADGRAAAAPDRDPEALTAAEPAEMDADLRALILDGAPGAPGALVTYDSDGGYGHPDHLACHEMTRRVARELELPLYVILDPEDPDFTLEISRAEHRDRVRAAHAAHASQFALADTFVTHSGGQMQELQAVERFRRVD